MKSTVAAAALLVFWVACAKEKPQQAAVPRTQPKAVHAAVVASPTRAPSPLDADYAAVKDVLDSWEGDVAALDDAHEKLIKILERDQNYAPAYAGLARCEYKAGYFRGNHFDEESLRRAGKFADHALKLDPQLREGYVVSAWIAYFSGNHREARAWVMRGHDLNRDDPELELVAAKVFAAENNVAFAIRLLRGIASSTATENIRARALSELQDIYRARHMVAEADAAYVEQLKITPKSAWAHGNYAGFLLKNGRVDDALREAETAVEIRPYPIAVQLVMEASLRKADELSQQKRDAEATQMRAHAETARKALATMMGRT